MTHFHSITKEPYGKQYRMRWTVLHSSISTVITTLPGWSPLFPDYWCRYEKPFDPQPIRDRIKKEMQEHIDAMADDLADLLNL